MTSHDWFVEQRTSFVVRALEPGEHRRFLGHLAGCIECQRETAAIERDHAWLPMLVDPVAPRPGLVHQVVEDTLGRRPRRFPGMAAAAVAASVVLAVGAVGWVDGSMRRVGSAAAAERGRIKWKLGMVRDTLGIIRSADRVRHAAITMDDQHGGMVICADDRSHRWNVVVYGVCPPSPGELLQFWFITDSGMVRGMQVKPPSIGPAFLTVGMPGVGGRVMGAALTLEPSGKAAGPPSGPELVHLML